MKKSLCALSLLSLCSSVYASELVDTARVISSTPVYDRVNEPRRECWNENVQSAPKERTLGGAVLGGIAGGILGNQVGGGNGQTVATAAGAIAGAVIGDRMANPDQPARTEQGQRCRDVDNYRDVIKGYTVKYRYNGQEATTSLPYQPGDTLRVGISVIEDQTRSGRNQESRQDDRRYRQGERN
ncbi:MAG: glycine zipper 2TM domain-containing protein [Nitrosomonadales bacterium]